MNILLIQSFVGLWAGKNPFPLRPSKGAAASLTKKVKLKWIVCFFFNQSSLYGIWLQNILSRIADVSHNHLMYLDNIKYLDV